MMLEPSSFLISSIVGFFSLDFSHGLNDNPHKKNHSPTCFTLTLTALWSSSFSEALWWQRWKSVKGYFCLWGLFSGVSLTFRGLTILGLGRMDYYFKEIVSTNSSSCVESCFFSYCLHCSYETKLKTLIGFFGFFHLRLIPWRIYVVLLPHSHTQQSSVPNTGPFFEMVTPVCVLKEKVDLYRTEWGIAKQSLI